MYAVNFTCIALTLLWLSLTLVFHITYSKNKSMKNTGGATIIKTKTMCQPGLFYILTDLKYMVNMLVAGRMLFVPMKYTGCFSILIFINPKYLVNVFITGRILFVPMKYTGYFFIHTSFVSYLISSCLTLCSWTSRTYQPYQPVVLNLHQFYLPNISPSSLYA